MQKSRHDGRRLKIGGYRMLDVVRTFFGYFVGFVRVFF